MRKSISVANFLARKLVARSNWGLNFMAIFMIVIVYVNINFTSSLLSGFISTVNEKLITSQTGNVVVLPKNSDGIESPVVLLDDIRKINGVAGATETRSVPAELSKGQEKSLAEISGINPNTYGDVFVTPKNMIEGEFLTKDDRDKIVIGAQIAGADISRLELYSDSLKNVHAGDKVTVNYPGGFKKEYTVKGIFLNEFFESDLKTFITDDEYGLVQPGGKVESINIKLEKGVPESYVIDQIKKLRSDLQFRTWEERAGFVKGFTDTLKVVNRILGFAAILVAAVTIFIVTYVDLINKRRQIGIERAIGINAPTIILSYELRALFYTIIGSSIGALVFIYAVVPIERAYPFKIPYGKVFLQLNYNNMIIYAGILVAVAIVAALIPAWRTIRISIIDAIWGN
jgi:putative ABC transport system permease protein